MNDVDLAAAPDMTILIEAIVFLKALGVLSEPPGEIRIPRGFAANDQEVELAAVVRTIASYVIFRPIGDTASKGKGCDTFGPTSPGG